MGNKALHILRRILVIPSLVMVLAAGRDACAQTPGNITVFADAVGSSCFANDNSSGTLTLFVVHTNFDAMLSSDFRVIESAGFHATFVSQTVAVPVYSGEFRSGIFLGYGECRSAPLLLGTLTYSTFGTSESCSYLDVVAGQVFPWPATQSCFFEHYPAPPLGKLYVNANTSCPAWCAVSTEASTWGKVKAMYQR